MQQTLFKHAGRCGAALLVWAACTAAAWAGPDQGAAAAAPAGADAAAAAAATPVTAKPAGSLDFGQPADLGKLEQSRGGTDTTHNTANLDGVVSGNSATNVVTGNNIIDAGSFANMSGIPVVIQNSGANVLIQSSTIVNLQFK